MVRRPMVRPRRLPSTRDCSARSTAPSVACVRGGGEERRSRVVRATTARKVDQPFTVKWHGRGGISKGCTLPPLPPPHLVECGHSGGGQRCEGSGGVLADGLDGGDEVGAALHPRTEQGCRGGWGWGGKVSAAPQSPLCRQKGSLPPPPPSRTAQVGEKKRGDGK